MKSIKERHAVEKDSGLNGASDQRKDYISGLRDREKQTVWGCNWRTR